MKFDLGNLTRTLSGTAAAFRCVTEYQPAGGPGDKIFPPTYEKGKYAAETRVDPKTGAPIDCVLLDSVQSQANRMELALLDAMDDGRCAPLPLLKVAFTGIPKPITVTSLEAPHRVADAIFRDSSIREGGETKRFRASALGSILDHADIRNATGLFRLCPTALVFGVWDSTGPRGGLGAKFQRAIVSEMVGYGAALGRKTSSRIDPLQIMLDAGPVYAAQDGGWTLDEGKAKKDKGKSVKIGKDGKPSEINHGNVTPTLADGGYTITHALQTTVLSLPTLRRLRFPLADASPEQQAEANLAARTTLAAIGLAAAALTREQGADLRSRCLLVATEPVTWELLDQPGAEPLRFEMTARDALALLDQAIEAARATGLPWEGIIELEPSAELVELVRKSQYLAAEVTGDD